MVTDSSANDGVAPEYPAEDRPGLQSSKPLDTEGYHQRTGSESSAPGSSYPPTQLTYSHSPVLSPMNDVPPFQPNGHSRVRSWSFNQPLPQPQYHQPPYSQSPMAYSPSGSSHFPVAPSASAGQNGVPVSFPTTSPYNGARRKRKAAGHRRARSHSEVSSYGSFYSEVPTGPSVPQTRSRNFSPRSEIMKLTGGFRSQSPSRLSPSSSNRVPLSPQSSFRGLHHDHIAFDPRIAVTPRMQSDAESAAFYDFNVGDVSIGTSPAKMNGNNGNRLGGEAVFLAQKKSKHRKMPSSRKMHMRQRSAQLFMEDIKGVQQLPSCRDIIFLILFVFHLLGIVYLGNTYGHEAVRDNDVGNDTPVTIIYQNLILISILSGAFAILVSALALLLMMAVARRIVQIALILTISLSFVWGTMGIGLSPKKVVPATGIIALALSVAYTVVVWDRCKFHGANLYASLAGIQANPGAFVVAFFFQFLALGWSIYFIYVAVGVYDAVEVGHIDLSSPDVKLILYGTLGISYFWTLQVFLNVVQVTVAGVIGKWWYTPKEDNSRRSEDLHRAFFQSCFYSIGSICFGSLFVGPVRFLRQLSALFRPSDGVSSLLCLHEFIYCIQSCLASCIDNLAYRFNPWAFTYVGLYGYNLMDAGLHSTELFEKRGWSKIVSDDLVPNVLLMTTLVIGGVTGCFAHLIETIETLSLTETNEPVMTSFVVGTLVGLVVSSVLFGIISSSVNAVIVCFAASPVDFENNHPALSSEMRSSWREVWPGCMDIVDMRVAVASYLDPAINENGEKQPLLP